MALLNGLIDHEIDTVFGLPGGQLEHFFDAMYHRRGQVRLIGSRHEQGASYMAFGYARSTGRPAVYTVVPGPGVLAEPVEIANVIAFLAGEQASFITGQAIVVDGGYSVAGARS